MGLSSSTTAPHLVLSGEIDLAVAPRLEASGRELVATVAPGRLELDLGDVTFIDSSGLGALIALRNVAREHGCTLVLVRVSPVVSRFFELAGLKDSFALQ
jgi:anti-anti-sigma factor